jgi:deoxyribodipyrimidine photolyase-related protein
MPDYPAGGWAETWDALYWTFVADHREVFRANPRLQTLTFALDRLGERIAEHRRRADRFLENLR